MMKSNKIKKVASIKKKSGIKKQQAAPLSRHIIPKAEGLIMIQRFRQNISNLSSVVFSTAMEFDKSLFEQLLLLKNINKVRVHNAINEINEHTFVITGVANNGLEIYFKLKRKKISQQQQLKTTAATPTDTDGVGNMADQCSDPAYKKPNQN